MKKKYIVVIISAIFLLFIGMVAFFTMKDSIDKKQLVGSWYIEGDDSPYFKLKENGKAKFAFSLVTGSNGQVHAGLCDVSCKWKIKNGHLVLLSITDVDIGKIISIEDDVMTCEENGEMKKYIRHDLGIYDVW